MDPSKPVNANVKLLACLVESEDAIEPDDNYYRILVDGTDVKYVTTAPGALGDDEIGKCFEPILLGKLLPQVPGGTWNLGHVSLDQETRKAAFTETRTEIFARVKNLWHPVQINELELSGEKLRQRIRIATHPDVNEGKPVFVKLAVWPWEMGYMEVETATYEIIQDTGIGPKFLGHLTEGREGRVIGFVAELIEGARHAGIEDLEDCQKALRRLHDLGVKLGDTNKFNFLVREGDDVLLTDFESAVKCSAKELQDEMDGLKDCLLDPSFRGGVQVLPPE